MPGTSPLVRSDRSTYSRYWQIRPEGLVSQGSCLSPRLHGAEPCVRGTILIQDAPRRSTGREAHFEPDLTPIDQHRLGRRAVRCSQNDVDVRQPG
jgi:hypothetical protein